MSVVLFPRPPPRGRQASLHEHESCSVCMRSVSSLCYSIGLLVCQLRNFAWGFWEHRGDRVQQVLLFFLWSSFSISA